MKWLMFFLKAMARALSAMVLVLVLGYVLGVGFVSAWRTHQPEVHVIVLPGRTA